MNPATGMLACLPKKILQVWYRKDSIGHVMPLRLFSALQMSQRSSKVSLAKAAAEAQPLPLAGAAPSADKDASASRAADLALIWTLEGPEGQPSRAGATHFYDVKEKVNNPY